MDGAAGEQWDQDPGWNVGWNLFLLVIPYMWTRYLRRAQGDPLANLRSAYLSFPAGLILFGLVVPWLVPFRSEGSALGWALALVVLAIVNTTAPRMIERPLSCDSLAGAFRTRMFLRIAFADTTALFGFVFAFVAPGGWLYFLGLLLSVPALVHAAPTRGALIRDQDALVARGCGNSLIEALRTTPPKPG